MVQFNQYKAGGSYILQFDMKVRAGAGFHCPQKKYENLTATDKKNAYKQMFAVLRRGTRVTPIKVMVIGNTTWLQIPSGFVCAKSGSTIYAE